jgi:predicted HicB family RNase H-like nuclease
MKRIIDGKTYNTDTATLVARAWWNDWERGNVEMQGDLYLTRGGAFFLVHTDPSNEDARAVFEPMDREHVDRWLATGEVEVFDSTLFQEPEEAAAEREPEATVYLRVPRALKDRIEAEARDDEISLNSWVMRCVERCSSDRVADALWRAHYIAQSIETTPDGYTREQCHKALSEIRETLERSWGLLGLPREKGHDLGEDVTLYGVGRQIQDEIRREWEPYQHELRAV